MSRLRIVVDERALRRSPKGGAWFQTQLEAPRSELYRTRDSEVTRGRRLTARYFGGR
jgi:hypothetical protein